MITLLKSTTTNPLQAQWFNQAHPETMKELGAWIKTHPGLIHVSGKQLNPQMWQNTLVFENEESANAFLAAEHEHKTARIVYNEAHGMTTTHVITAL
jgi:hypothetical protein